MLWAAKTVRDNAIPGRVGPTDAMLATGGVVAALAFTYVALFINWDKIGTSLGLTIWTALTYSLFSTMFFVRSSYCPPSLTSPLCLCVRVRAHMCLHRWSELSLPCPFLSH